MAAYIAHPFPVPENSAFSVLNIPFGVISTENDESHRPGVAIGDHVLDLRKLVDLGHLPADDSAAATYKTALAEFRKDVQALIRDGNSPLYYHDSQTAFVFPRTDSAVSWFSSHGEVPSNFFHIPLAYNGRASSVLVRDAPVVRPWGTSTPEGPKLLPPQKLDIEVEVGIFISNPVENGQVISASQSRDHIFRLVLLSDWSARDIQFFEMTPLSPFKGKAFATSISPCIVTLDALEEAGAVVPIGTGTLPGGKWTSEPFYSYSQDISVGTTTNLTRDNGRYKMLFGQSDLKHLHWSPF
ncbi:hypothetical protein DL764_002160 [Monosporascus ibericus]|uniref:Fumarylacetoacetase n=1 Tax=Monosporascus ibericus TaxID=155417 RepID=A0A4Q4TP19_9PEZI|nr:hypothetical protein DL764_002160 [Monosporascus ibericus]